MKATQGSRKRSKRASRDKIMTDGRNAHNGKNRTKDGETNTDKPKNATQGKIERNQDTIPGGKNPTGKPQQAAGNDQRKPERRQG